MQTLLAELKEYKNVGVLMLKRLQTVESDVQGFRKMEEDGQSLMRETSKWLEIADK